MIFSRQRIVSAKNRMVKRFQQELKFRGESAPAFLIGAGRSGTSMLIIQLGKTWQVDIFNEDHPAAFERWFMRDLALLDDLVASSHAPVTLFKPILETYRARQLLDRYPNGRILFATRYFDDVVNSSLKKFGQADRIEHINAWVRDDFAEFKFGKPPRPSCDLIRSLWHSNLTPADGAALYWLLFNRLYFDLGLASDERVMLVQYESLVARPTAVLADVCQFLDIQFEPAITAGIFASSVRRGDPSLLDPPIRAACQALWQRLEDEVVR